MSILLLGCGFTCKFGLGLFIGCCFVWLRLGFGGFCLGLLGSWIGVFSVLGLGVDGCVTAVCYGIVSLLV